MKKHIFIEKENSIKYLNIYELSLIIIRRMPFILVFTFSFMLFSIIYSGLLKKLYMSSVEIEFRSGPGSNYGSNLLKNNMGFLNDFFYNSWISNNVNNVDLYAHIALSPQIIDRIIEKNNLKNIYRINNNKYMRDKFINKTKVTVNELNLLEIRYIDEDRILAYNIIKSFIEEIENYYNRRNKEVMKYSIIEINSILGQIQSEIDTAKTQLKDFQEKYGIFDLSEYAENLSRQITDMKMQLISSELEYKIKYSEYKNLGRVSTIELRVYEEKISDIRKKLDNLINNSNDFQIAYKDLPKLNQEYVEINLNLKSLYTIYEQLKLNYNVAKLGANKEIEAMLIVKGPEIAEDKFYPYRAKIVIQFTILAFIMAIALCFAIEFIERSIRNKENRKYIEEMKEYLLFWKKINLKNIDSNKIHNIFKKK